jgi:hypothetical protein
MILSKAQIAALRRERRRLLGELGSLWRVMRGTFVERFSTCSRPGCACHTGRRHGPRFYVAVTQERSQRQHYVPQRQVEAVREGIAQYHRLLEILDRLTAINLQLMRGGMLDEPEV